MLVNSQESGTLTLGHRFAGVCILVRVRMRVQMAEMELHRTEGEVHASLEALKREEDA